MNSEEQIMLYDLEYGRMLAFGKKEHVNKIGQEYMEAISYLLNLKDTQNKKHKNKL